MEPTGLRTDVTQMLKLNAMSALVVGSPAAWGLAHHTAWGITEGHVSDVQDSGMERSWSGREQEVSRVDWRRETKEPVRN